MPPKPKKDSLAIGYIAAGLLHPTKPGLLEAGSARPGPFQLSPFEMGILLVCLPKVALLVGHYDARGAKGGILRSEIKECLELAFGPGLLGQVNHQRLTRFVGLLVDSELLMVEDPTGEDAQDKRNKKPRKSYRTSHKGTAYLLRNILRQSVTDPSMDGREFEVVLRCSQILTMVMGVLASQKAAGETQTEEEKLVIGACGERTPEGKRIVTPTDFEKAKDTRSILKRMRARIEQTRKAIYADTLNEEGDAHLPFPFMCENPDFMKRMLAQVVQTRDARCVRPSVHRIEAYLRYIDELMEQTKGQSPSA